MRFTNAATRYQIFCQQTALPAPGDRVNRSKFHFFRTRSCCISNLRDSQMQQKDTKYFACRPRYSPSHDPRDGLNRSKFHFLFIRTWSCCIPSLRESRMQQHGSKYFACRRPPPPWDGVNKSKFMFYRTGSCCISN